MMGSLSELGQRKKAIDDLRKKVKILQAVGCISIEAEDWEVATSGEEMSKMESLLLDKNRKMEHELTQSNFLRKHPPCNSLTAAKIDAADLVKALHGRRFGFNEPQRTSKSGAAVGYCSENHSYSQRESDPRAE
ncbi:hypothetical protein RIF29_30143 [Crotalaria pallida]|uniref:Uncharacterized protein n=1 Tax=Crotalaria pallida TaxID=3830 RepID=A0AAN9HWI2_CROPI